MLFLLLNSTTILKQENPKTPKLSLPLICNSHFLFWVFFSFPEIIQLRCCIIMKSGRMAKRSSFGSIVRKRLSDITNSQSQPKLITQEENQLPISNPTQDVINQLLKVSFIFVQLGFICFLNFWTLMLLISIKRLNLCSFVLISNWVKQEKASLMKLAEDKEYPLNRLMIEFVKSKQSNFHSIYVSLQFGWILCFLNFDFNSKTIAVTDNQLRNLRLNCQKLQLQNWNLAQSHSQMLAVSLFLSFNFS